MNNHFEKIIEGYKQFRDKYASDDSSIMRQLADGGQQPKILVVACCDSRVDPALLLQCDPGDLFVVRNIANIIPPYESDEFHHGTSAALEFGLCYLNIKDIIILGHSQCGGINALLNHEKLHQNDFISRWVDLIKVPENTLREENIYAKYALVNSFKNCLTFPWVKQRFENNELSIHLWYFDIKEGKITVYNHDAKRFEPIEY